MIKLILKISFFFVLLMFLSLQSSITQTQVRDARTQKEMKTQDVSREVKVNLNYGKIPLYFIPNKGQVNKKALFYAKASRYTLWLTKEGLVFDSIKKQGRQSSPFCAQCPGRQNRKKSSKVIAQVSKRNQDRTDQRNSGPAESLNTISSYKLRARSNKLPKTSDHVRDVSRLIFLKANKNPEVVPVNITEHKVNYFIGNDESKWKTDISTSKAVLYRELYKNIDLKVYGMEKQIEYDFIVKPGGEVSDISFEYKDVKKTKIDEEGNLLIETDFGELQHAKPVCYQSIKGQKILIDADFKKITKNIYGFRAEEYNRNFELIIDPLVLIYSTYLGGSEGEVGHSIAVDKNDMAYVTGLTQSPDFPTKDPIQSTKKQGWDVFITKINSKGKALVYSTYLSGCADDYGYSLAVDKKGAAYVTGKTYSPDFPVKNAFKSSYTGGWDIFITKIDPDGSAIVYSTYLGDSKNESGHGIAVDKKGAAYVTGYTYSTNFPTKKAFQKNFAGGEFDAFITKIDSKGKPILYSTFLGGLDKDWGLGITVDKKMAAYVTGHTYSTNFPTKNAFQKSFAGGYDAFITKINSKGKALLYSTFLGGYTGDVGNSIAVDKKGAAYVTGHTISNDFPLKQPIQGTYEGGWDVFVTKINPKGKALLYSTFLGGSNDDHGYGLAVDKKGAAYVTGLTESADFPTNKPIYGNKAGDYDVFITNINPKGKALVYSTYLGGSNDDRAYGIAVDNKSGTYVTGSTYSPDFPTNKPIYGNKAGDRDVFITKLKFKAKNTITKRYYSPDTPIPIWEVNNSSTITVNDYGTIKKVKYHLSIRDTWSDWLNVWLKHKNKEDYVREDSTPKSYSRTTDAFDGLKMDGNWTVEIKLTDLAFPSNYLDSWWIEITYIPSQ